MKKPQPVASGNAEKDKSSSSDRVPTVRRESGLGGKADSPGCALLPRFVRVELHEVPPPNKEPLAPMFIDLAIDDNGHKVGKWLVFGWRGYPGKRDVECTPFVIEWEGKIDFGSGWDYDKDRYGQTDLFKREIAVGQFSRFDLGNDGAADYQIARVHELNRLSTSG